VAEIDGVGWYDDSKATTPEGAITALEAFDEPEIIIAGGYDKHILSDELGEKIAQKAKAAILLGQTAEKISTSIHQSMQATSDERRRSRLPTPYPKPLAWRASLPPPATSFCSAPPAPATNVRKLRAPRPRICQAGPTTHRLTTKCLLARSYP
jgi:hypothetical protein